MARLNLSGEDFLFCGLSRHKVRQPNGKRLSYSSMYLIYKTMFTIAGVDPAMATHSTRIGAAVEMANQEIDGFAIKSAGGWKSDTYLRYTQTSAPKNHGMGQLERKQKQNR